jgi:tryptophan synthase beta subunit
MSIGQNYTSISPEMGWYQMDTGVVTTAIQVVETLNRARLVFNANDLQQLIEAAEAGHAVGMSSMTKEQASALSQLITSLAVYLNTPMSEGGLKPIQVLYRQWAAPVSDETP